MKNEKPTNKEGQRHGPWERYNTNGQLKAKKYYI